MYEKMQESGLTEIIPLICTSDIWGQCPLFSHHESPQAALYRVGGGGDWSSGHLFPS